jgi:glycogen debranching enzyme GlgX
MHRFQIYAPKKNCALLLLNGEKKPMEKVGDSFLLEVDASPGDTYAFQLDEGPLLLDPYGRFLNTPKTFGMHNQPLLSRLPFDQPFDWKRSAKPNRPFHEMILYEAHVRGFTKDSSSGVTHPGTYLGFIEKIPYLQSLGINAVELLPLFEFDETKVKTAGTLNYWGYNPISFFAPMNRYAVHDPIYELKLLVRELHRANIEVILDVVYNHTGEGNDDEPTFWLRGFDKETYYLTDPSGKSIDHTGCGNTLNTFHPVTEKLILDSLNYFLTEFQVDGFRFDLASCLSPSLRKAISKLPCKLIAEPWDAGVHYELGAFPFLEWNDQYRDAVRTFLKGTSGAAGRFGEALSSFSRPNHFVNYVTSHDGFSLMDLVTYQNKRNEANLEHNTDGSDVNHNWNCGIEGPTSDPEINALRKRQMENHLIALFTSIGSPMVTMGDEYGHTRLGNNNPYIHDNELNHFLWKEASSLLPLLSSLRPRLAREKPYTSSDIDWQNTDWKGRYVSFLVNGLFIAFNADYRPSSHPLPEGRVLIRTDRTANPFLAPYSSIIIDTLSK